MRGDHDAFSPALMRDLRRLHAMVLGARGVAIEESTWPKAVADDPIVVLLDDAVDLLDALLHPECDDGSGVQCHSNRARRRSRTEAGHAA